MFREMLQLLTRRGKRELVLSGVFFAFYGLSSIGMIILVFSMLLKITGDQGIESLYGHFAGLVALVVFKGVCNVVADLEKHCAGFDVVQQIREKMIIKLKQFSLGFYTNERLGEINTVLHKDVDNMSMVVGHMWARMLGDYLVAAVVLVGLTLFNLPLGIAMVVFLPVPLGFLYLTINRSKKIEQENNSALVEMVSLFVEYVRGIPVLKSFSNNRSLDRRLVEKTMKFGDTSKRASRYKAKQLALFGFLLDLAYFILLVAGGIMTWMAMTDVVTFMIFAVISREFYKPFASMEMHYMYYVSAADSYERLGRILHADVITDPDRVAYPQSNDISFNKVGFSYEKDGFALREMSFAIPEHTMVALVGESGSGKTTITNLLLRFYDVKEGEIRLGGVDIREIPYDELLDRVSIVMQNVELFDRSILENVRVGKKEASREEIIEACKKAKIHDFIETLPKGYETSMGENGGLLSGGQRQRISIARAFLKDAPILILDEMTSNVDPVNEALIQDAITLLARDRTVIVIAHHLKTIQRADNILVFKRGELVEQGHHGELMKRKGQYAKLWNAQYGGLL